MFEGKERRRQLIGELRTTHALQAPEQKIKKQEAELINKKKLEEKRFLHKVRICAEIIKLIIVHNFFMHKHDTVVGYFHTFTLIALIGYILNFSKYFNLKVCFCTGVCYRGWCRDPGSSHAG